MKRKRPSQETSTAAKRQKLSAAPSPSATWQLLQQYYPTVTTLRRFFASQRTLSKRRRRTILCLSQTASDTTNEDEGSLARLLDGVVVGTSKSPHSLNTEDLNSEISIFTQQVSETSINISPTQGAFKQSEIVDFVLWRLFRSQHGSNTPHHLLCRGYQNYASNSKLGNELITAAVGVPGLFVNTPNRYVQMLKDRPWTALPSLLGPGAERVLADLLLYCGLFEPVGGSGSLRQISGVPLCELKSSDRVFKNIAESKIENRAPVHVRNDKRGEGLSRGLGQIKILRHRMLYAKPSVSRKGNVYLGLPRHHVLNNTGNEDTAGHLLRYIFPRQFKLHNVFTSDVNHDDTSHQFNDYTTRERELTRSLHLWRQKKAFLDGEASSAPPPLPKRLRHLATRLAERLIKRHQRCAYVELLNHYCPAPFPQDIDLANSIRNATPMAHVSAFCRAVVSKVFPDDIWGDSAVGSANKKHILRTIDTFLRLRRYETLTLHDVLQHIRIHDVEWLALPNAVNEQRKMSAADFAKRQELMAELLYYLFDSFLIPLIRGHFYVTESGAHRNQLFYFRHDVWQALAEPALDSLKHDMLEPCITHKVKLSLDQRALGVSSVRLLPKDKGMRPIINLRRRQPVMKNGKLILGKSINSLLTPTFSVLNHERGLHAGLLASAMFSVEDLYPRLQAFRSSLARQGLLGKRLFFAKVDVRACFDTIPQERLMRLVERLLSAEDYCVAKYARGKLLGSHEQDMPGFGSKPSWRYLTKATTMPFDFGSEVANDVDTGRTKNVYVDGVVQKSESRKAILKLLEEHVQSNLIKLGSKYYRQKEGIPQGSIVSSLLCSYFYADMGQDILGFVNDGSSMMLRLIDDFLVISTRQDVALRFLTVMHAGVPEYGVDVKAEKSRANFAAEVNGITITRLPDQGDFPYCGNAINTVTLDLSKDVERRKKSNIPDSISVEYSNLPGQTFYRKMLNALKLQMQSMLLSTTYNSVSTVMRNLYHSFSEVAQKCYHYVHSMPAGKQPSNKLLIKTLDDLIKLACVLKKRSKRSARDIVPYDCDVNAIQVRWLACTAFKKVFEQRQTKYRNLIRWIAGQLTSPRMSVESRSLDAVVRR